MQRSCCGRRDSKAESIRLGSVCQGDFALFLLDTFEAHVAYAKTVNLDDIDRVLFS
jgi:hypothetical protein